MRGGLDDALDKLARRDELRRRAAGEATGTPPAVTELVEGIAAVVGRHPELGVTVGVEGAGEPLLLHFYYGDGQVQVNAENAMVGRPSGPTSPAPARHADVVVEAEEAEPAAVVDDRPFADPDPADRWSDRPFANPDPADRWSGGFDDPPDVGESSRDLGARMRNLGMATTRGDAAQPPHPFAKTPPPPVPPQTSAPQPMPAAPRSPQPTSAQPMSAQPMSAQPTSPRPTSAHPMSPPPMSGPPTSGPPTSGPPMSGPPMSGPPVSPPMSGQPGPGWAAPVTPMPAPPRPPIPPQSGPAHTEFAPRDYNATRRIRPDQFRAPGDSATERIPQQAAGMPRPLPKPIPLQVERPEETEMAARRLAALLRDDPGLLSQPPD